VIWLLGLRIFFNKMLIIQNKFEKLLIYFNRNNESHLWERNQQEEILLKNIPKVNTKIKILI
jgi:hypothetical protein